MFWVLVDGIRQHRVEATDGEQAIKRWLDDQGYDSVEEAAEEYGVVIDEITAETLE